MLEAQEEEDDHNSDENAADPSAGVIKRDEVETSDQIAKKDEESEAPALAGGVSIDDLEKGVSDEVLNTLLEDTIKPEAAPEQLQMLDEAASKDEMPAGPDEEVKTKEQLEAGVQADDDDEDDVADVPDDGTVPTAEEPVPEGNNIKATESVADEGLVTDGKPDVLADAEEDGTNLEDLVANANAATEEAEAEEAPEGEVIDHLPTPEAVQELMEELGTPDIDLSVTGMESEYAESFGQWDEQDDPDNELTDEAMYEQQHMDEMADGTDPSMFTTTEGDIDDSDTDVARRRRRAAETTYTPV